MLGGAIELQDGVDTNFPDSPGDGGVLRAAGEFALVFVTAEFAFDGHMGAFGEGASEIGQFSEGHASMPLGAWPSENWPISLAPSPKAPMWPSKANSAVTNTSANSPAARRTPPSPGESGKFVSTPS